MTRVCVRVGVFENRGLLMEKTSATQSAVAVQSTSEPADSGWHDRLVWELISGSGGEKAVATCVADGYPESTVREAARSILSSPLFRWALVQTTRLKGRDWMFGVYAKLAEVADGHSVAETHEAMSRNDFIQTYYARNRAVVLRGLADRWPATRLWSDPEYLKNTCGDMEVEIMVGRERARVSDQNTAERLKRRVSFTEYVNLVYGVHTSNDCYIVSRNHFFASPSAQRLLNDIHVPPYVQLVSQGDDVRLWFGPAGTFTALHQDNMNNLFVQVVGRKVIRLYPPYFASAMRQSILWYAGSDPASRVDSDRKTDGTPMDIVVQLGAGDALFIPVGWWHAVKAMDPSMTLAFINFGVPNNYPVMWNYEAADDGSRGCSLPV